MLTALRWNMWCYTVLITGSIHKSIDYHVTIGLGREEMAEWLSHGERLFDNLRHPHEPECTATLVLVAGPVSSPLIGPIAKGDTLVLSSRTEPGCIQQYLRLRVGRLQTKIALTLDLFLLCSFLLPRPPVSQSISFSSPSSWMSPSPSRRPLLR